MYQIIGADQNEYGPLSPEQMRQCIAEGRVTPETQVQAAGSGEWKPLSDFPEFAEPLKRRLALHARAVTPPHRGKLSVLAISSLVLGVLAIVTCAATVPLFRRGVGVILESAFTYGTMAFLGVVLGIVSLIRIHRKKGELRGLAFALAGTLVSALVLLLAAGLTSLVFAQIHQAKSRMPAFRCMNNLRQLGWGVRMYLDDHEHHFPPAATWGDALQQYVGDPSTFRCPLADPKQRCHFAFNAQLSGVDRKQIAAPSRTVLFFEIDSGWNVSGGSDLVLRTPRHPWPPDKRGAVAMAFVDGHTEMVNSSRLPSLRWNP